jgi:hypothetical protein
MSTTDSNETSDDVRAERDALRAELDAVQRRKRGKLRRFLVVVLVLLSCIALVAGVIGVWARRNFLDTNRFVDRAAPLINDPNVQSAITIRLSDQIITLVDPKGLFEEVLPERGQLLAVPLSNAVDGWIRDRTATFVASDRFEKLWVGALTVAHRTATRVLKGESDVVQAGDGTVTLNLIPVVDAVLQQITSASPTILGRTVDIPDVTVDDIPDEARQKLADALGVPLDDDFGQITVYNDSQLSTVQDAVSLFDKIAVLLIPLGFVLAALALWLSPRRRRTLLQLCAGLALGMVLLRRGSFRVHDQVAALPPLPQGQKATSAALTQFLDPLQTFALWVLWAVIAIVVVAVLTGSYPWVVSLRARVASLWRSAVSATSERAHDESTVAWVRAHRDALLIGGGAAGFLVLWTVDLGWLAMLLVLAVIAAYELAVLRIGAPEDEDTEADAGTASITPQG